MLQTQNKNWCDVQQIRKGVTEWGEDKIIEYKAGHFACQQWETSKKEKFWVLEYLKWARHLHNVRINTFFKLNRVTFL